MQTRTLRATTLLASLLLTGAVLPGCLIGSTSSTRVSGRYVSQETMDQIQPGKSQHFVLALLGEPSSKSSLADGTEIWKWHYTEEKTSKTSVVFLLGAKRETENTKTTYVEMKDGVVVKAWRD